MHSAVIMRMHLYRTGELISHELPTYRCFANSFACCQLLYCMPYYLIIITPQNCPTQLSIFRSHQHEVRYLVLLPSASWLIEGRHKNPRIPHIFAKEYPSCRRADNHWHTSKKPTMLRATSHFG